MKLPDRGSSLRLLLLTAALLVFLPLGIRPLAPEEERLYHKVTAAQTALWEELGRLGLERDENTDPWHSGFIGLEWSMTTTTTGDLQAKRCSTDPLWAVQALRWFDQLGLSAGDRVTILASSSFPGMLYSILAAAEARGLDVALCVSLGSSNWGANRPEAPWPVLASFLRRKGFLRTSPAFYTLGAADENGGGLPREAVEMLIQAVREEGLTLLNNATLEEAVEAKMALIHEGATHLVVNIGGNMGNLGTDPDVLKLSPGLIMPRDGGGNGVLGKALKEGYPALHILNMRRLAAACGIAWEDRRQNFLPRHTLLVNAAGLTLFLLVLATHRRWSFIK